MSSPPRRQQHFTYDANGNTPSDASKTYSWDFENRLSSVTVPGTGTTTFRYDALGRRIQKSGPLGTTNYLYDGRDLTEEVDSSGNVLARYTQGPGIDQPLSQLRSGTTSYYHQDVLGSVTSLSDGTGALAKTYAYDSFGKLTSSTGTLTNPFQYTGREFDQETALYFYRARYLDQDTGRFLSEDPVGFNGDGANFYAYMGNDPVNYDDPMGLAHCTLVLQEGATSIPLDCIPDKPGHKPVHIPVASGNNGNDEHKCKNSPKCTDQEGIGAIPEETWTWTNDYTSKPNGRVLLPDFDTNRTLIRSHSCANPFGPSRGPKFCSEGCVTGRVDDIRQLNQLIDSEPGSTLTVTSSKPKKP